MVFDINSRDRGIAVSPNTITWEELLVKVQMGALSALFEETAGWWVC